MIYTVTLNPSIDYVIEIPSVNLGEINKIGSDYKFPGGKGINVSRVLNNLGSSSVALGFIGGFTGEFVKATIEKQGVKTNFVKVSEDTRINVKVKSKEETELNGSGPHISKDNLEKLCENLNALNNGDILVMSGSIPKSLPEDIYSTIMKMLKDKEVKVVLDTTGKNLLAALKHKPFLIKPNNHELSDLFNVELKSQGDIINTAEKLLDLGAENVIISMAGEGALLITKDGVYHGNVPKGTVKNSVGAGDSLIAGFIYKLTETEDKVEAFKYGITTGSATAFSEDLAVKEKVEELINEVSITKVK